MTKIRPFLKWAGGKFRYLEHILYRLPSANRLIEPFAGSGAIFINSNYPHYLLGEANADLIALFKQLKKEGVGFIDYCEHLFSAENNEAPKYYQLRERFNRITRCRERAALFLYLNRHGYNGLCRYNQKGIFNVPFGRYNKPYFPRREMLLFYQKSKLAQFTKSDFRQTFKQAQHGDLIYCDPPYVPISSSPIPYVGKRFAEQDQIELAHLANECISRGVTTIISNHDTPFTRHHYRAGEIISFPVKRFISCQGNKRYCAQELLAIFK